MWFQREGCVTTEETAAALREHPFLEGFRPDHIDTLAGMAGVVRFRKTEVIFREGDASSFFYLLLSGAVALEVCTPGRTVRIATLAHGDELGWSSLMSAGAKQFQARSLEAVEALAFDGARLLHACEEDYAFGYALTRAVLRILARRLQATRLQLLDIYSPIGAKAGA